VRYLIFYDKIKQLCYLLGIYEKACGQTIAAVKEFMDGL
jgi:hypothetical protein